MESIQNYHLRLIKVTIVVRPLSSVASCSNLESRLFDPAGLQKIKITAKKKRKEKLDKNRPEPGVPAYLCTLIVIRTKKRA